LPVVYSVHNLQLNISSPKHFHAFIHYRDLYSAYYSEALPISVCMVKKNSLQARVKCVGMNPGSNRCADRSPFHTDKLFSYMFECRRQVRSQKVWSIW